MNPLSYFYGFKGKELDDHTVDELRAIATRYQIPRRTRLRKDELVRAVSRNLRYQKSAHAKSTVGWKIEAERDKIRGEGERFLRGVMKKQETDRYVKTTGQQPDKKGKMKIAGRVNKRMST